MRFCIPIISTSLFLCFTLMGCAQTQQYTPRTTPHSYQLTGLPSNIVDVQVNDFRPETSEGDGLKDVLRRQVLSALSPTVVNNERRYRLAIDIIEHRSFFTLGNWNASTRFRVKITSTKGELVGQWDAIGTAHRSNMSGYVTAEEVSQDSYNIAAADMMSSLSQVSLMKGVTIP